MKVNHGCPLTDLGNPSNHQVNLPQAVDMKDRRQTTVLALDCFPHRDHSHTIYGTLSLSIVSKRGEVLCNGPITE